MVDGDRRDQHLATREPRAGVHHQFAYDPDIVIEVEVLDVTDFSVGCLDRIVLEVFRVEQHGVNPFRRPPQIRRRNASSRVSRPAHNGMQDESVQQCLRNGSRRLFASAHGVDEAIPNSAGVESHQSDSSKNIAHRRCVGAQTAIEVAATVRVDTQLPSHRKRRRVAAFARQTLRLARIASSLPPQKRSLPQIS
jgi:hypothetical protein